MTAKEYLRSNVSDEWADATSVQTRTALCAYAIRMNAEVDGYNIDDAEKILRDNGCGDDFTRKCLNFISDANAVYQYTPRIPHLDD